VKGKRVNPKMGMWCQAGLEEGCSTGASVVVEAERKMWNPLDPGESGWGTWRTPRNEGQSANLTTTGSSVPPEPWGEKLARSKDEKKLKKKVPIEARSTRFFLGFKGSPKGKKE